MIIQENQLRPPSPKEMAARHVQLERVRFYSEPICWDDTGIPVSHYDGQGKCSCPRTTGRVDLIDMGFSTQDLIEFHKEWNIPYEADVTPDGYDGEIALNWTHLKLCEGCRQWYGTGEEHETTDTSLHGYIVRAREAAVEAAKERDKGRLK